MLNFNFSEKVLALASPLHFVYDFSRKMLLMLHSINSPNFIVSLPLLLEIWVICVLQLFFNQAVTSHNLKLTLSF